MRKDGIISDKAFLEADVDLKFAYLLMVSLFR